MTGAAAALRAPAELDRVLPFHLPRHDLRGRLVRLGPVADGILRRHAYPAPIAHLLGETVTLACTLAAALKYEGIFTLQAKGDGPVSMLVADVTSAGHVRGYAGYDAARFAALGAGAPENPVPRLLGAGYLAFTVDQGENTERYQGIVELTGPTLAACTQHYFRQSEQIGTILQLAVSETAGQWRSGALLVQRLPREKTDHDTPWDLDSLREEEREDGWRATAALVSTLSERELLDPALGGPALLWRLFHEDGVRVFAERGLADRCRCSRERAAGTLRMLNRAELDDMKIEGAVIVTCQFCNRHERFDDRDIAAIFAEPA